MSQGRTCTGFFNESFNETLQTPWGMAALPSHGMGHTQSQLFAFRAQETDMSGTLLGCGCSGNVPATSSAHGPCQHTCGTTLVSRYMQVLGDLERIIFSQ